MTTPIGPTKEQIDELRTQLRQLPDRRKEIAKAKLAGFDVSDEEKRLNELEGKINQILKVYG